MICVCVCVCVVVSYDLTQICWMFAAPESSVARALFA